MAEPTTDFPGKVIAELLGLTERRLQQLAAEGHIPKSERGRYPLIGAVQGYIAYLKENSRSASRSSEAQRLTAANADRVEMANREKAGEYILREHVQEMLSEAFVTLIGAMEGIPGRTANEFAASEDAAYIRRRQQEELRRVRTSLADFLDKRAKSVDGDGEDGDADAAAEVPDTEPMGGRREEAPAD